jgi:hypothetical protein
MYHICPLKNRIFTYFSVISECDKCNEIRQKGTTRTKKINPTRILFIPKRWFISKRLRKNDDDNNEKWQPNVSN